MLRFALPVVFCLFVWWFGTGVALYVVRVERTKLPFVIGAATLVLAASAWGLAMSARTVTTGGAYLAFTCAVLVWCWLEITFLSGVITGPRTGPCPVGASGWRRFGLALGAILYHELALLAFAAGIVALTWQGSNQVGAATFLILWTMRVSAKLNLFLGVPILNAELLPGRLDYLKSYFVRGPINALFPVAVTGSTIFATLLAAQAAAAASRFETSAFSLLATLVALAVLEHWFMVVPLPFKIMWEWGVGPMNAIGADGPADNVAPKRRTEDQRPPDTDPGETQARFLLPNPIL
jgi:putative photosynthetic complex assembly protein 2